MIKEIIKLILLIVLFFALSSIAYYAKKSFYKDTIIESFKKIKNKE